jgi:formate dehydrogenase major subunit
MIIGANPAEQHPAAFLWVFKAMEKGAKLIVVDPRIGRTASKADTYVAIRSGTDIAFIGAIVNYILENQLYQKEYVVNYTNAASLINPDFKGPADLDGLYSGYDKAKKTYDTATWQYQTRKETVTGPDGKPAEQVTVLTDPTLQDPNCVFQLIKKHYSRYTLEKASEITGASVEEIELVAQTFGESGAPEKSGTLIYAMGGTQHTVGTQNVRIYALLQLLLGNVGMAGGGVNALRGESNVQGSTDMALLFQDLPGYLGEPTDKQPDLVTFLKKFPRTGYLANGPKFFTSLMKAWWGEKATPENEFAYQYLPKTTGNYSWIPLFEAMFAGTIKGLYIMGQNPAVCGPNARMERKALENLEWMAVAELFHTETTDFWKAPGVNPKDIKTEIFLLPASEAFEKEGSITNSGRIVQWRPRVASSHGEQKTDIWILTRLTEALKDLYENSEEAKDRPILDLVWDYGSEDEPDVELIAREINGYALADAVDKDGKVLAAKDSTIPGFAVIASAVDTATVACGNWIYSGYFAEVDDGTGKKMPATKRRNAADPSGLGVTLNWAFAWPANRRVLYNRASCKPDGSPWNPKKALIFWDAAQKKWTGPDVPDFAATKAPDAKPKPGGTGLDALSGTDPFIMRSDGKGWAYATSGLNEGPLPEHYEPLESPIENLMSSVNLNPVVKVFDSEMDKVGTPDEFPIVATTYRLVEHWQAGAMSRTLPWLAELQPGMFVEISEELAAEKDIKNGDEVEVSSARGTIKAVAMVTMRLRPFKIAGKTVHQLGMPWHYGWSGLATGDSANYLTPHVGDGNTMMPEYKAFLVDIKKVVK